MSLSWPTVVVRRLRSRRTRLFSVRNSKDLMIRTVMIAFVFGRVVFVCSSAKSVYMTVRKKGFSRLLVQLGAELRSVELKWRSGRKLTSRKLEKYRIFSFSCSLINKPLMAGYHTQEIPRLFSLELPCHTHFSTPVSQSLSQSSLLKRKFRYWVHRIGGIQPPLNV
jgi:hypothetical protein